MNLQATNKFLAFLKDRFQLEEWELPIPGEWSNMGNTIGAIALRTSLLSLEQIDGILDLQDTKSEHKLFGQLAIELSFLTPREVDGLLSIQALSAQLSLASQLVLQGRLELLDLLKALTEFSSMDSTVAAQ